MSEGIKTGLTVAVLVVVGLLMWNAYLRPYHGPGVAEFREHVASAQTCEGMWGLRSRIDSAQREGGMTEAEWQSLQDAVADRAKVLQPQMAAGEPRLLCADLIVPCLPRGAVCYLDTG